MGYKSKTDRIADLEADLDNCGDDLAQAKRYIDTLKAENERLRDENEKLRELLFLERQTLAKKLAAIAKGIGRLQEAMRGE